MKTLRTAAVAGTFITVAAIISICILNLQYLYSILQSLVPLGCIGVTKIGEMYSFTRDSILTWTLICVALLVADLLLALAIKGAADRGERSAAVKLSAAYLAVSIGLLCTTYITYTVIREAAYRCSTNAITIIGSGNIIIGAIVLASAIACISLSMYESRRYARPARLYRPSREVSREKKIS